MNMNRRYFLKSATAVTVGFAGLQALMSNRLLAEMVAGSEGASAGFGPLVSDPAGIFDLPQGFSYKIISRVGQKMEDGFLVPGALDGMAAFPAEGGRIALVRNHELLISNVKVGPFGEDNALAAKVPAAKIYDAGADGMPCLGGTTNIIYNPATGETEREYLSLVGTVRNCAGGPTPWGTWITCEETEVRVSETYATDHGYNFEIPANAKGLVDPVPLKAMGRFSHEAVAVNPNTGIVYQTEDTNDGLIYRFIPNTPGELHKGGKLQALVVIDKPSLDTRNWDAEPTMQQGDVVAVRWIDMDEVESPKGDLRLRGFTAGAARFARGEGMWYGNDAVYFACTNGGRAKKGQIWKYTPSAVEGTAAEDSQPGTLELFIDAKQTDLIQNADNIAIAPWGDVIICEDNSGPNHLVGVTPKGEIYRFGKNINSKGELAGACFSPDGSILFVNMMYDGYTIAITGPWKRA